MGLPHIIVGAMIRSIACIVVAGLGCGKPNVVVQPAPPPATAEAKPSYPSADAFCEWLDPAEEQGQSQSQTQTV